MASNTVRLSSSALSVVFCPPAKQSPRWKELRHAYGEASDIPGLIENLKTAPPPADWQAEPWFSLWSALCHQNDVYSASYAAIPHIAILAAAKPKDERLEYIHFISWVEACRHRKAAPPIPEDLESSYLASIKQAGPMISECLESDWDELGYKVLLGALAIVRGQYKLGAAIFELEVRISDEREHPFRFIVSTRFALS